MKKTYQGLLFQNFLQIDRKSASSSRFVVLKSFFLPGKTQFNVLITYMCNVYYMLIDSSVNT